MTATVKKNKRRGWWRFFAYVMFLIVAFIIGGFVGFAYRVDHPVVPSPIPNADGIVVWTGKGGGRLDAGAKLLSEGHGERLLISGVNENNSREDVMALLNVSADLSACCIDLDYAARDTVGNARETSNWSEALGYEHIILVTSAYHMPRAKIEISGSRERIRITPYPVLSDDQVSWWKNSRKFRRLYQEYGKLMLAYLRRTSTGSDRATPVLDDITQGEAKSPKDTSSP